MKGLGREKNGGDGEENKGVKGCLKGVVAVGGEKKTKKNKMGARAEK